MAWRVGVARGGDGGVGAVGGQGRGVAVIGACRLGVVWRGLVGGVEGANGARAADAALGGADDNTRRLGEALFTDHVFAVELTARLRTVAVVGAVVLARRLRGPLQPLPVVAVASMVDDGSGGNDEAAGEDGSAPSVAGPNDRSHEAPAARGGILCIDPSTFFPVPSPSPHAPKNFGSIAC